LVCRNGWIKEHPDLVRKVLSSLAEAEEYIVQHPSESKAILQRRYRYSDEYVDRVWPEHQFSLSLDQSLVHLGLNKPNFKTQVLSLDMSI
jgi:ABC-type nitrate/sulfonate/bicarbonate transport system substrate-binding protein